MSLCDHVLRDLRKEVEEVTQKTAAKGKEHGFLICQVGDKFRSGAKCSGTECGIRLKDCSGAKNVGAVHSHAVTARGGLDDSFSTTDLQAAYGKWQFSCIIHSDSKLRCTRMPQTKEEKSQYTTAWTKMDLAHMKYHNAVRLFREREKRADSASERSKLLNDIMDYQAKHFVNLRHLSRSVEIDPCERTI